jgi:asparagine synthase (glutamine-hydrolysing)
MQKEVFRGRLPPYVYAQRKKGFGAPIGTWLRRELRPMIADLLAEPRLRSQGIFNAQTVARLVRDHLTRREDHTDQLWGLIVLQLWLRAYGLSSV